MKHLILLYILFIALSAKAWADCPSSITGASLFLSIDNDTNLKIISSLSCGTKEHMAQKFIDADVELWSKGKKIGGFYSRRVTYSGKSRLLVLNQAILQETDTKILRDSPRFIIDLKKNTIVSTTQLLHF